MNRLKLLALSILSSASLSVVLFGSPKDVAATFAYQNNDASTYYSGIDKYDTGNSLTRNLNTLNNSKRQRLIPYDNLTQYFSQTDPGASSNQVTAFYSGTSARYSGNMSREHIWPYSRLALNGDDRVDEGKNLIEQDLHMVRPALKDDNTGRGNKFFTMPDGQGWDPGALGDESYRGDSARIVFYCTIADLNLTLADKDDDGKNNRTMGKMSTLLEWNLKYPVKDREKTRNEAVESIQGHRNPFIDHPEYACRIWGNYNTNTRRICGSYGLEGQVAINNSGISDDEYILEIGDTANFTASFSGDITPTYSWTFSDVNGLVQETDIASINFSNSSSSVTGLKAGITYLKVQATYTVGNGSSETIWKAIKLTVVPRVDVTSIQVTNFPNKISYYVGDTFNSYGIKVMASFSDGSSMDVTNKVTYENTDLSSAGTKTITVKYQYKQVTVQTTFNVFVREQGGGGGGDTPAKSGGCGGNIMSTSIILSSLSLIAAFLITVSVKKRKKK